MLPRFLYTENHPLGGWFQRRLLPMMRFLVVFQEKDKKNAAKEDIVVADVQQKEWKVRAN